ncbi:MAG: Transcriptional regulator, GntR family protein [Acidimicrobiales bacterium]|nr:Transcriptional regulator, GntR family protein [Acidimicrobiales bacterium]
MPSPAAPPASSAASPPTLAEWVDGRLRDAILLGELAAGEKLRSEHLAAEWGVSPTPVREAFQRLAGEGLVVIEPQRGARVAGIDAQEATELYELRLVLDPKALRSAMAVADDAYRAEVDASYRRLIGRHDTVSSFLDAHRAFHLSMLSGCTNRQLHRLVVQLHNHTQRFHVSGAGRHRHGDPMAEHAELHDAVLAAEASHAAKVLVTHLRATLDAVTAPA